MGETRAYQPRPLAAPTTQRWLWRWNRRRLRRAPRYPQWPGERRPNFSGWRCPLVCRCLYPWPNPAGAGGGRRLPGRCQRTHPGRQRAKRTFGWFWRRKCFEICDGLAHGLPRSQQWKCNIDQTACTVLPYYYMIWLCSFDIMLNICTYLYVFVFNKLISFWMCILTPVLKTSSRLLLWNFVQYTFPNKAVLLGAVHVKVK